MEILNSYNTTGNSALSDANLLVKEYILSKFAEKFQTDAEHLDLSENLLDMGLDSSIVIKIAEEFEQELEIKLYPTVFFEYKTLQEIIGYFTSEFSDKIVNYYSIHSQDHALIKPVTDHEEMIGLHIRISNFLKQRIASVLEIHPDQINMEENLLDLGLGSSSLVSLAEEFEKDIKITLYPTVFFEYQNLSSIADYFAREFKQEFEQYFDLSKPETEIPKTSSSVPAIDVPEPNIDIFEKSNYRAPLQVENLHGFTLHWEKVIPQDSLNNTNNHVILLQENDFSEIKKHLFRKTFQSVNIPASKHEFSGITLEEATPYNFILYINEDQTLLSQGINAVKLVESVYMSVQNMVKKISVIRKKSQYSITVVIESTDLFSSPLLFAFRGLMKSVSAELPYVKGNVTGIDSFSIESLEWIKRQTFFNEEKCTVKIKTETYQLNIIEKEFNTSPSGIEIKDNSSYLISGGSGKLGQLLAMHIASKARCTVVLLGRKPQLTGVKVTGSRGNIIYRSCDVKNRNHLREIIKEVGTIYGPVKGVIHAAGIIEDGSFLSKKEEQLKNVLDVKIAGLINLDKTVDDQPLDFFTGFSSISSFIGNRGQTDYATANGFMDGYLRQRQIASEKGQKKGKSISINWPLWESGGMMPHQIVIDMMEKSFGLFLLGNNDGLFAFDRILASDNSQLCVIKGQRDKLERLLGKISSGEHVSPAPAASGNASDNQILTECEINTGAPTLTYLKSRWSEIKSSPQEDPYAELGYGDISMKLTKLLEFINKDYRLRIPAIVITNVRNLNDIYTNITKYLSPSSADSKERDSTSEILNKFQKPILINQFNSSANDKNTRDIAVVGMDGRFPQSPDVHVFWKNLENEKDMVTHTPEDRLKWWKVISGLLNCDSEEDFMLAGGYIDNVDKFDADYFKISGREAEVIDPQQRLFLESVWKCIQDAGYTPQSLSGTKTGVFAAVSTRDYHELLIINGVDVEPQHSTGLAHSILPNRVSYWLNLHGPSEAIDTACSSSLVALNRAVQAIHNGDCEQAIVGGVNLVLSPLAILAFGKTGILGKDGRCKTFDKSANGYARGEGVGSVFLKPLNQAIAAGDVIHGVIKGTSVNHGGRGNSLTAPNPTLQADVISQAIRRSGCDINSINYIEAHGTGTALGDPVEIEGLKRAFRTLQKDQNVAAPSTAHCGIGAVKSNIGHLEAAAGMAGLIKVLMALKHKKIPASLHIQEINPFINLNNSPFYIVQKTRDWPKVNAVTPRRAGLSSFGFGGTNAHVVLEEFIRKNTAPNLADKVFIIPFSAPSAGQLIDYLNRFLKYLKDTPVTNSELNSIAYTLQTGRTAHEYRQSFTVSTINDLLHKINQFLQNSLIESPKAVGNESPLSKETGKEIVDKLINSGNYKELSNLWQQGKSVDWKLLYDKPVDRLSLPTFPLKKTSHWLSTPTLREHVLKGLVSKDIESNKANETITTKSSDIKEFLVQETSALLKKNPEEINSGISLMEYGLDSILGMTLVKKIEQKLNMPVYVNEILQYDSIDKLSAYLQKESTEKTTVGKSELKLNLSSHSADEEGVRLTRPVVFLLSTPRSGSTLLRAMLMGNSKLFAPPELHLLNFSNLKERKLLLGNSGLGDGLIETIKTLKNTSIEEAKFWLEQEELKSLPVKEVYRRIQDMTNDMMLIDKSPSYASDINVLRKAEKQFSNAKYVFLVRHPFAVMESIVRNRFHKFIPGNESDPDKNAEKIWYDFNKNIVDFISEIPAGKAITVYYEDLIANPKATLTAINDFLQIPFEESMLNPYEGNKLIKGLHDNSMSVGDPNFLKHDSVKKEFSYFWKSAYKVLPNLNSDTKKFASRLGYDIAQDLELSPVQKEFLNLNPIEDKWVLNHEFSFSLNNEKVLNSETLAKAVGQLIELYPLFQRIYKKEEGLLKWNHNSSKQTLIQFEDISVLDSWNQDALVKQKTNDIPGRINIYEGPVLAVSIFLTGINNYRGVIQYHHFYGDGITSITLLKNLISLLNGSHPEQNMINESYINYLDNINDGTISFINNTDATHGLNLPVDNALGSNTFSDQAEMKLTLQTEQTEDKRFNLFFTIGSALVTTLGKWTNTNLIPLDVRYHGRIIPNFNKTYMNSSGFFAYDLPLIVNLEEENQTEAFNKAYMEAKKTGFKPRVIFNNVRLNFQPFQKLLTEDSEIILNNSYEYFSPQQERKNQLDCIVRKGSDNLLEFIIRYSKNRYNNDTIEYIIHGWIAEFNYSMNHSG
ncbi:polyketide synthase [Sporocytophaga myxococcoides]|uniref:Polyketide synthase n=1 Tax=Sporocytophaga myxococcoides TaxID=153721 RepID=A0A098L8M6_9BACT|nr:SDR family NAD(P)-dependent oxidoreductase [Sporocytophaga myxococcoides]GAL83171.1 polyketide synthase [Sporocytophaga myxococcoides]